MSSESSSSTRDSKVTKSPVRAIIKQPSCFTSAKKVDILLGSLNISFLSNKTNASMSNVLIHYKLMVKDPTHINVGLVDCLYLMKQISAGQY